MTFTLSMILLGAPASRRPVGSRKPELAGGTPVVAVLCPGKPALPGTVPKFRGSRREKIFRGIFSPGEDGGDGGRER
jgi:hypothetical protein